MKRYNLSSRSQVCLYVCDKKHKETVATGLWHQHRYKMVNKLHESWKRKPKKVLIDKPVMWKFEPFDHGKIK